MRAAAVLAAALLLAGCPGNRTEDYSQVSPPRNSTSTANTQAVPGNTAKMNPMTPAATRSPSAAITPIAVQLTEYAIQMPDSVPAGPETFQITNAGKENHNFAIEGPGVAAKLTSDLTRGDSQQIALNLKPGTYTVYCPVENHRSRGMQRTLTVR